MAKADINRPAVKKKAEQVKKVIEEMKGYKTVSLVALEKLPDSLLQLLRKKIKEDGGKVRILRKAVLSRVLESNPKLKEKVSEADKPAALIMSNWTPYQLNKFFKQNTKKRAAKTGETAPYEIVVPEGETDLPPGPALSELKAGGVNVQIKGGKIVVAKDSTVAKSGDKITSAKSKALQTLGIKPFTVEARMVFGYDGEYIYEKSVLDVGDTVVEDLTAAAKDAFNLSVNADYPTAANVDVLLKDAYMQSVNVAVNSDTYSQVSIDDALMKALMQSGAISKAVPETTEAPKEEKTEEKKEEAPKEAPAEKPEEKPAEAPKEEKKEEPKEAPKAEEKLKAEKPKEKPKEEKPKEEPKKVEEKKPEEKAPEKKEEKPAEEKKPEKAPKAEKKDAKK